MRTIEIKSNNTAPKYYKSKSLLSINADAKTKKGIKYGFLTGILYLAPYNSAGHNINTCSMAKIAKCNIACLNTAGRGAFNSVQNARINKTLYFKYDFDGFINQLIINIKQLINKAHKLGLTPLIRLNGTSDIKWENIGFVYQGKYYNNIFEVFPYCQYYDYTKLPNRLYSENMPPNYDLTFSYSGVSEFEKYNNIAINNKMRIAVVFKNKHNIPKFYMGLPVISGDNSDIRHLDNNNTIIALYAKGKAKYDNTGFVVNN